MKFGHFDDNAREYVITNPRTPYPWINYLGNQDFFSLVSNTAGGYTFYKDAKFRRLTRYRYNNVPVDNGGKYFYINDGGDVWNPGWKPTKTELDNYSCRHGMSYTKIAGERNGIMAEVTQFIPLETWAEVQRVKLKNTSNAPKKFKFFSFIEWCLWNAEDDMQNLQRNFSTGEVEVVGSTIYHKTEFKERRNHYAFYNVNAPIHGFDTDRDIWKGTYNDFDRPDAVYEGKPRNSEAHGWSPCASHYIEVELAAGEEKNFVFTLGYIEVKPEDKWESKNIINKEPAKALMARFDTNEKVEAELQKLADYWEGLLSTIRVKTADERIDRSVNIWNQ